jgi:hypothetical protein
VNLSQIKDEVGTRSLAWDLWKKGLAMNTRNLLRTGIFTGLAGGAAEVAWVIGYAGLTGASSATVARGVTSAFLPGLSDSSYAIGLGLGLHMLLAVGLGIIVSAAFSAPLLRRISDWPRGMLVVLTLGAVWAFNFLVVLPILEPSFLTLLPAAATLASKLLFGVAAAVMLQAQRRRAF